MNQVQAAQQLPSTIDQVKKLPHDYARSHAAAVVLVSQKLPSEHGPIASRKLFVEDSKVVYEFYRLKNKDNKFYIIF